MVDYFNENMLSLNLSKSKYLIINGKEYDYKCDIVMKNGVLPYKHVVKYLGALISDTGSIKTDVDLYVKEKRPDLTIKFSNFCKKNYLAPLSVKLQVLLSCVCSVLIYSAETWGNVNNKELESLYRQGIKCALSIRNNVNNEIVYLESDLYPLIIRIKFQQTNFWRSMQEMIIT